MLTGGQRQGDLLIVPTSERVGHHRFQAVPQAGIQVVVGESTGNTHWLHNGFDSEVLWAPARRNSGTILGWMTVPEGQTALLIHTDEHGAMAMGPGTYEIRQRRQATETAGWRPSAD